MACDGGSERAGAVNDARGIREVCRLSSPGPDKSGFGVANYVLYVV